MKTCENNMNKCDVSTMKRKRYDREFKLQTVQMILEEKSPWLKYLKSWIFPAILFTGGFVNTAKTKIKPFQGMRS